MSTWLCMKRKSGTANVCANTRATSERKNEALPVLSWPPETIQRLSLRSRSPVRPIKYCCTTPAYSMPASPSCWADAPTPLLLLGIDGCPSKLLGAAADDDDAAAA